MSTRLADEKFFNNVLDTSLNGLEDIPSLVAGKEFDTCRKIFADYYIDDKAVYPSAMPFVFERSNYDVRRNC